MWRSVVLPSVSRSALPQQILSNVSPRLVSSQLTIAARLCTISPSKPSKMKCKVAAKIQICCCHFTFDFEMLKRAPLSNRNTSGVPPPKAVKTNAHKGTLIPTATASLASKNLIATKARTDISKNVIVAKSTVKQTTLQHPLHHTLQQRGTSQPQKNRINQHRTREDGVKPAKVIMPAAPQAKQISPAATSDNNGNDEDEVFFGVVTTPEKTVAKKLKNRRRTFLHIVGSTQPLFSHTHLCFYCFPLLRQQLLLLMRNVKVWPMLPLLEYRLVELISTAICLFIFTYIISTRPHFVDGKLIEGFTRSNGLSMC